MLLKLGALLAATGVLVTVMIVTSWPGRSPASNAFSATTSAAQSDRGPRESPPSIQYFAKLSARDLVAMSDADLTAMDPLVMNMIVARGVPELADLDMARYVGLVDAWAQRIGVGIRIGESDAARASPAYAADPDIWRAGSMAIALASTDIGIAYTRDVRMSNHADLFVPGLIDSKRGTCSNMPVLYMAVARRLGWPLKAVVAADHMWCRWDDGAKSFNLEATTTTAAGGEGSFSTPPDEAYRTDFDVSSKAIEVGSDLTTLTARQTLGVYLQQRAGYFREKGEWTRAEEDLLLARVCFPENRDIFRNLLVLSEQRAHQLFTAQEALRYFGRRNDPLDRYYEHQRRTNLDDALNHLAEIEKINRENQRRLEANRSPQP